MDEAKETTRKILREHGVEDEQLEKALLEYWIGKCRGDVRDTLDRDRKRMRGKTVRQVNIDDYSVGLEFEDGSYLHTWAKGGIHHHRLKDPDGEVVRTNQDKFG